MWFKKVLSAILNFILPLLILLCRLASSAGSSIFMLFKFNKLVTGKEESKLIDYVAIAVVIATIVVQLFTRGPKIYRQFQPLKLKPVVPTDDENPAVEVVAPLTHSYKAQSVYYILTGLAYASSVMTLPNNYLNGTSLFDFGAQRLGGDPTSEGLSPYRDSFATIIAFATFINYIIFSVSTSKKNAARIRDAMTNSELEFNLSSALQLLKIFKSDTKLIWTLLLSAPTFFTVPCQAIFSTRSALQTLANQFSIFAKLESSTNAISYGSGLTAFISQATTQPQAVKDYLDPPMYERQEYDEAPPWWANQRFGIFVKICGLVSDFGTYGLSSYASVGNTFNSQWHVDIRSGYFIAFNSGMSICSSTLYFSFSVLGGWQQSIEPYEKPEIEESEDEFSDDDLPVLNNPEPASYPAFKKLAVTASTPLLHVIPIPPPDETNIERISAAKALATTGDELVRSRASQIERTSAPSVLNSDNARSSQMKRIHYGSNHHYTNRNPALTFESQRRSHAATTKEVQQRRKSALKKGFDLLP